MTDWPKIRLLEGREKWHRPKYNYRKRKLEGWQISAKRAEYWLDQHRKKHEPKAAEGANASLIRARAEVFKWGKLMGEEAREINALKAAIAKLRPKPPIRHEGYSTPQTSWNPSRRPIANWIIPELAWAHEHGWTGYVTSGLRTYAKQKELYELYLRGGNIAARPGSSNHEGYIYPRGAVDTPQAEQLNRVLNSNPHRRLLWAETHGLADFVHFSGTGR